MKCIKMIINSKVVNNRLTNYCENPEKMTFHNKKLKK